MRTIRRYYRVDRRQINLIRFTIEAYEGIAVVSTLDADAGLIVIYIAPGCERLLADIMEDLGRSLMIEPADPPESRNASVGAHDHEH